MGEMAILNISGDTKTVWDSENEDEVAAAEKTFDDLMEKGYMAFRVKKDGDKGRIMRNFDSEAEKMILAPRIVGG